MNDHLNDKESELEQDLSNPSSDNQPIDVDKDVTLKESEYKKVIDESNAFKDKYVRLLAEFDNARKRNERERGELIKYAHEEVIIESLSIYEDLERAVEAAKKFSVDAAALVKGLEMVFGKMKDLLKKYDVRPVESVGKKFDPFCHEAMMQAESSECEDGTIIEEFQKGYWLGNRVVRTAKVKVAKNIAQ